MKTTQIEVVKNHLMNYGSITSMEAFFKYRITRLASVIHVLRKQGLDIETITETSKNQYGTCQYAKYILNEG